MSISRDIIAKELISEIERKRSAWIQTFSKKKVYPLDLTSDQVDIIDIAHALSLMCRYGGHCSQFFSIAEHSIYVAEVVAQESNNINNIRWALLHDASEAYIPDICRPLKEYMPEYCMLEDNCMGCIIEKFNLLPHYMPSIVKLADTSVLYREKDFLMPDGPSWQEVDRLYLPNLKINCYTSKIAEEKFLVKFHDLFEE